MMMVRMMSRSGCHTGLLQSTAPETHTHKVSSYYYHTISERGRLGHKHRKVCVTIKTEMLVSY
jgi:hypothetical protein